MHNADLFPYSDFPERPPSALGTSAIVLPGYALTSETALLQAIDEVVEQAPLRHMLTPGGKKMSVAMTNCGALGWVSGRGGYRYEPSDPVSAKPWPAMPAMLKQLAAAAAARAGFEDFVPDACLINRYHPGARMALHQDKDEASFDQPIVSISLGLPAVFLFGGFARTDRAERVPLGHGDVVVWGGVDRLRFHGVMPLKTGCHPRLGEARINLTLRKAG